MAVGTGTGFCPSTGSPDRRRRVFENEETQIAREAAEDAREAKHLRAHRIAMTKPPDHPGHPPEVLNGTHRDRMILDFRVPPPGKTGGT